VRAGEGIDQRAEHGEAVFARSGLHSYFYARTAHWQTSDNVHYIKVSSANANAKIMPPAPITIWFGDKAALSLLVYGKLDSVHSCRLPSLSGSTSLFGNPSLPSSGVSSRMPRPSVICCSTASGSASIIISFALTNPSRWSA